MISSPQNFYVKSKEHLQRVIELIKAAKIVALDTEFTRRTTYYPILSIIQIAVKNSSGEKEFFIVDCLENVDLSELFAVIADEKIIKILHSATQDLQIFHCESSLRPQGVVDTQIMANFCGFDFNVGYSSLVESLFNQKLDKQQQNSDWQRRPLGSKQLEYALLDVRFLEEIYDKFYEILIQKNRVEWFLEEMQNFTAKTLSQNDDNLSKKFCFKNRDLKQIAQIKDLILWREIWARKVNVPRQHLLRDEEIERMVVQQSFDPKFSHEITKDVSVKILDEMQKILDKKSEISGKNLFLERKFFMNQKQKNCYQEAKNLMNKIASRENFSEQFLITSSDLKLVVCDKNIFDKKVTGWRYKLYGRDLEQLISSIN
jgi:ribonuclease D